MCAQEGSHEPSCRALARWRLAIVGAAGAVAEALTSGGEASPAGVILLITLVVFVITRGVALSSTRD